MPILPRTDKTPLGLYIHIPFCKSKCQYCDFYSLSCEKSRLMDQYLKALCAHIKETGPLAPGYRVDTVYFGGGTPSYFGPDRLAAVLTAIRQSFDVSPQAEITFEANPDSVTRRLLRRLKSEGFNRVSLGIQSDDNAMLQQLGRPHTYEEAVKAVQRIRRARYRNVRSAGPVPAGLAKYPGPCAAAPAGSHQLLRSEGRARYASVPDQRCV